MFQKYLDLAHKSEVGSTEGARGAKQVLYILSTLKECLALMSKKCIATLIEGFKVLMILRDPYITRPVIDSLNAVCLNPTTEVPVEALVEVLSLAAGLFSGHETSADAMTFTARLLKVGMTRTFFLNRDLCVVKLPSVFNGLKGMLLYLLLPDFLVSEFLKRTAFLVNAVYPAVNMIIVLLLADIVASEHEEAIFAATDALKSLISSCIDESLIREGVNGIRNSNLNVRKSSPTVIEKLCATIESLLHYKYHAVWDMAFQVVSAMFDKLGNY